MHNYCGIRDNKQLAKAVAIAFLGEKFNDEKLKGNPWTWEDESWIPPDEFDVANDFPDIKAWQKNFCPLFKAYASGTKQKRNQRQMI